LAGNFLGEKLMKLLDQVRTVIRKKHYSIRTEEGGHQGTSIRKQEIYIKQ